MKRLVAIFAIVLSRLALASAPTAATVFVRVADEVLAEQAEVIAEVSVLSIDRQAGDRQADGDRPATDYLVEVERPVSGGRSPAAGRSRRARG